MDSSSTDERTRSRCLFCGSETGKRSREHVLRKDFKKRFPSAKGLTFTYIRPEGFETVERPIGQFDITVNHVCRECNSGWLNDLENSVIDTIDGLSTPGIRYNISPNEMEQLGYWSFVRALIRTHASPHGKAPPDLFERVYRERSVLPGCYTQLATIVRYTGDAGAHQSCRLVPGNHYVAYVAFELGRLLFTVGISDNSELASNIALDAARQPRLWFPGAFCWTAPKYEYFEYLLPLDPSQVEIAAYSLGLRLDMAPRDRFGNLLNPDGIIPALQD